MGLKSNKVMSALWQKFAITIVHNPVWHNLIKHAEVEICFVNENLGETMDFPLVNSEDQLADTFDKGRVMCQAGVSIYALTKLGI